MGQQKGTEFVGKRHQRHATQPCLHVFLGGILRQPREKRGKLPALKVSNSSAIGICRQRIFRFSASSSASTMLPLELCALGMAMPVTFSAPNASTANAAVTAESIAAAQSQNRALEAAFEEIVAQPQDERRIKFSGFLGQRREWHRRTIEGLRQRPTP